MRSPLLHVRDYTRLHLHWKIQYLLSIGRVVRTLKREIVGSSPAMQLAFGI